MSTAIPVSKNKRVLLREKTYDLIKHKILVGQLTEGTLLSERSLTEMFSIGITPVRNAVTRLCSEGYLEIVPQRGMLVRSVSLKDMMDIFELRLRIEPYIVTGLTGKLDREVIATFEEILQKQALYAEAQDAENFIVQDLEFHMQLCSAYGNDEFSKVMEHNCQRIFRSNYTFLTRHPDRLKLVLKEHTLIFQAMCEGDMEQAVTRITDHLDKTKSLLFTPGH